MVLITYFNGKYYHNQINRFNNRMFLCSTFSTAPMLQHSKGEIAKYFFTQTDV